VSGNPGGDGVRIVSGVLALRIFLKQAVDNVPSKLHACTDAKIPMSSCNNACKQCAVATKIVIQCTCLFFHAALLKTGRNIGSGNYN